MVKIAFLINSMAGGGAERVVSILLENLSRENRKFYLILLEDKIYYDIPEDVEIIKLNSRFFGFKKLKEVVQNNGIDLVISFLGRSNYINILSGGIHKKYISERVNPSQMHASGSIGLINKILTRWLYPKANLIFTNSLGTRNSLNQEFNIPLDKIRVIYNPIDLEKIERMCLDSIEPEYQEIFKTPVIINVGRFNNQKDHISLIKSFKIVSEQIGGAKLLLLGEGVLEKKIRKLARNLGIEDRIIFAGWQKNPFKFMKNSNVFVLSSLWEGLPNTLIEALACGVPAVSTDCPSGPDEIIDSEENGVLVPVGDYKAMADAIVKILKNQEMAYRFIANGRRRIQEFSVKNIIDQYEKLI